MNKLRKELYDCFYVPPKLPAQKQEIEECHQALIHAPDQFLDLVLDYFLVQLHDFIKYGLLSPFRMVCRDFILPEPASYVFFYALFNLRKLLYLIAKCAGIDVQRRKGCSLLYGATRRKTAQTSIVWAVCSAGRTYSRQESIEVCARFTGTVLLPFRQ